MSSPFANVPTDRDGGPAFPITIIGDPQDIPPHIFGMTLRDWFAGQALIGVAHLESDEAARVAYEHSDAMLQERAKPARQARGEHG